MSSFPVLSGFGVATVIVVIFSLFGAAAIMPATLALIGGQEKNADHIKKG